MKELFDKLYKLKDISSTNLKKDYIKNNSYDDLFLTTLEFLLNNKVTNISKAKINKKINAKPDLYITDINSLFRYLYNECTGKYNQISSIQCFINKHKEFEKELKELVTKSMKLGVKAKLVNDALGYELIPTFDIMLASKFDFDKPPKEKMYISEKLDGIRCNAIIRNGKVKLYTRQGKIIEGLEQIEQELSKVFANAFVDGELLAEGCSYEDVYKETTKRVKNKNKVKTGVKYIMFDTLSLEEFDNKKCKTNYDNRRLQLDNCIDHIKINNCEHIEVLPILYEGKDIEKVLNLLDEYRKLGAEGLMCNLNKPYEFKRSKTILKLKVMQSCDLKIIGFESGDGKYSNTLGKIICDYKGYELGVGSGFTDTMRDEIYNNQDKYLNRIAEINYFEETHNEDGGLSLRFPIFKCVREEGKEVSYE